MHPDTPITASFTVVKDLIKEILDIKQSATKPHSFFVPTNDDGEYTYWYTFFENHHSVIFYKKKLPKREDSTWNKAAIKLGFTSFVYNDSQIDVTYKDGSSSTLDDKKWWSPFCTFIDQKYDYSMGEPEAINTFLDKMRVILEWERDASMQAINQRSESVSQWKAFLDSF